jgi:hypothetical protein
MMYFVALQEMHCLAVTFKQSSNQSPEVNDQGFSHEIDREMLLRLQVELSLNPRKVVVSSMHNKYQHLQRNEKRRDENQSSRTTASWPREEQESSPPR